MREEREKGERRKEGMKGLKIERGRERDQGKGGIRQSKEERRKE